jgi:hypothetical protein
MKTMKPRRSPERDPSFTNADEHSPRWPWEQPPAPEAPETKEEPSKPQPDHKKKHDKEKNEKPSPGKSEQIAQEKVEKEENERDRRVTLLERSLALTKKFEETPIPNDPHMVARLMIAKRVVAVNEQLETPPAERSEPDEVKLLATLDYLGDLSDKFEDPDSETSSEIDEAYQAILHLAAEVLENEEPEILVEQVESLDQSEAEASSLAPQQSHSSVTPSVIPPSKTDQSKIRTSLTSLPIKTIALLKLLLPKRQWTPSDQTELAPTLESGDYTPTPEQSSATYPGKNSASPIASERLRTESHATLPFRRLAKNEYLPHRSLPVVAPVILGALALGSKSASPSSAEIHQPITASPEGSHYHGPAPHPYERPPRSEHHHEVRTTPIHATHHELPSAELLARPSYELQKTTTAPEVVHASLSAQKFEFMSLHTLLDAATHVSVGHGEYLRRAYERGQIDKAGLISVLKSNAKGRDFIAEYRHQADRTRRLKATSPEFLHSKPTNTNSSSASEATPRQADMTIERLTTPTPAPRSSSESVNQTLNMLKTENKQPLQRTWATDAHPMKGVWVAIGLVAAITVALITVLILALI